MSESIYLVVLSLLKLTYHCTEGYLGWKTVKDVERPFWDAALQCEPSSDKSPSIVEFTSKEKGRDPRYHLIMVHNRK